MNAIMFLLGAACGIAIAVTRGQAFLLGCVIRLVMSNIELRKRKEEKP